MPTLLKTFALLLIYAQLLMGQSISTYHIDGISSKASVQDSIRYLDLPDRPANALEGSAFAAQVSGMSIQAREQAVVDEILSGNVPTFSRQLKPLTILKTINGIGHELIFYTTLDYMAIGSEQDYFYIPMTPSTAQHLADQLDCILPTKKMVDAIYSRAELKLSPQPIPPSAAMVTVPVFRQHTDSIKQQFSRMGIDRSADSLIGGTKKDIIISNKIYSPDRTYDRVVIYGWHTSVNNPIQPVYNGHIAMYADYSHGVRLTAQWALLDGDSTRIDDLLPDSTLWPILSSEGVIARPYYPPSSFLTALDSRNDSGRPDFQLRQNYPNPFNPITNVEFGIRNSQLVRLMVYDLLGREVRSLVNDRLAAGQHLIVWDGTDDAGKRVASGVYYYRLTAGSFVQTRKMLLVR